MIKMFRAAILAIIASVVSAKSFVPSDGIPLTSRLGKRMLEKAIVVEPARRLADGERSTDFISQYALKYTGCSSFPNLMQEGGGGEEGMLTSQHIVKFSLCPNDSCSSCSGGGEYVVNMLEFVDAYTEAKLTEQEYKCEMIRENCYNDDENSCYAAQGADECIEYEGQEEFEIQRYLECAEMEDNNNNNNNQNQYNQNQNGNQYNYNANGYYGQYFIGPYCSAKDSKSIFLGVFYDESCVNQASTDVYGQKNYGATLPFSSEPIVTLDDCMSCKDVEQGNNNNNNGGNNNGYYYAEPNEFCAQTYEMSARCEKNMDIMYPDTSGCDYINNFLPRIQTASRSISTASTGGTAGKALAWVFAATTVIFGAYAYFLYRKIKRGTVNLASQDGSMA